MQQSPAKSTITRAKLIASGENSGAQQRTRMPPIDLWFQLSLDAYLPQQPTFFTASIFRPAAERALTDVYAEFGAPLSDAPIAWHSGNRRAELNGAALEQSEQALRRSPPSSGLGRLLGGGQNRRVAALIAETLAAAPSRIAASERWAQQVQAMEWRQATILQIMEEIEARAQEALANQQRVALSLALAMHALGKLVPPQMETAIGDLAAGLDSHLPEANHAAALRALASELTGAGPSTPSDARQSPVDVFLSRFGRWADAPLEMARPRWADDPARLLAALPELVSRQRSVDPDAASLRRRAGTARISQSLGAGQRRLLETAAAQVEQLATLVPQMVDAIVSVAAAARYWVSGAAHEGMADGRLASEEEVFLLELEELKQMMTGEWNDPQQVRSLVAARRASARLD